MVDGVAVSVGVEVKDIVAVDVTVPVGVSEVEGVADTVFVADSTLVADGVTVVDGVNVLDGVADAVGDGVAEGDEVAVLVLDGVAVEVAVAVGVRVDVAVFVGVRVAEDPPTLSTSMPVLDGLIASVTLTVCTPAVWKVTLKMPVPFTSVVEVTGSCADRSELVRAIASVKVVAIVPSMCWALTLKVTGVPTLVESGAPLMPRYTAAGSAISRTQSHQSMLPQPVASSQPVSAG